MNEARLSIGFEEEHVAASATDETLLSCARPRRRGAAAFDELESRLDHLETPSSRRERAIMIEAFPKDALRFSSASDQLGRRALDGRDAQEPARRSTLTRRRPARKGKGLRNRCAVSDTYGNTALGVTRITTGGNLAKLVREPGGGTVVSQLKGTDKSWLITDQIGSTTALISTTGAVQRTYAYDVDGNDTPSSTGTLTTNIKFAGGHDIGNGLYHFGARYYQPSIGRWTQMDPLVQPSDLGQANRYTYVGNNPINATDPSGLIYIPNSLPSRCWTNEFAGGGCENYRARRNACGIKAATNAPIFGSRGAASGCITGYLTDKSTIGYIGGKIKSAVKGFGKWYYCGNNPGEC